MAQDAPGRARPARQTGSRDPREATHAFPELNGDLVFKASERAGIIADRAFHDRLAGIASDHAARSIGAIGNLGDTRKALRAVSVSLREGSQGLRRMAPGVLIRLAGIYRGELPGRHSGGVALPHPAADAASAERLADMIDALLCDLPSGGRPRNDVLDDLIGDLIALYEHASGSEFSSFDRRQGNRGSDFVTAMAGAIDPELDKGSIWRAMERLTRFRNALKKQ